ncbi:MAG TPA: apolipoprotein N-acyltransferase [Steroidobacteraceae bacterium]
MRNLNFYGALALSTLSGCLWFLAVTPFNFSALAWVAAIPMFMAIERTGSLRSALFLGWWAGMIETAGGFYWLIDTVGRFADFPWIGGLGILLLFCATRAIIFLLFTAIVCVIRRRVAVPMTVLGPLVMVACELSVPQLFPCGQYISQAWNPHVIQISELTGPAGVTALLMLVNGALYDLILDARRARNAAIGGALLLAAALIFGAVRMRQVDQAIAHAPGLRVGLVQPNFANNNDGVFSRDRAVRELGALQEQSRRLEKAGAQLTVWSEGSYPMALPHDFNADFPADNYAMVRRDIREPTLIGVNTYDAAVDQIFNSAILFDKNGKVAGRYDKAELLAFGEYIPGLDYFPWLRKLLPAGLGGFTRGAGPGVLSLQRREGGVWQLGPLICYEDIIQEYIRGVGQLHPNLLVNMTVDSWYGATAEPWEHLALAVFATVELRVSLVRAVNSGVSALIDPNGRMLEKTYANDPYRNPRASDGIVVTAPMMPGGRTLYVAVGNLFSYLCLAATLIILGVALLGARARRAHPAS